MAAILFSPFVVFPVRDCGVDIVLRELSATLHEIHSL